MYEQINEITFKISPYCNLDCEYCFQKHDVKTKYGYFNKYDELLEFLKKLPIGPKFEIKLTGGETSLYPDQIRLAYRRLKKLERYKDTEVRFTTISNGTNMDALIELFSEGILDPWGSKISWDGIYSASKSRKPKNKLYTDDYFSDQICKLGKSKYGKDVLVRTALTKNTIDDLYDSMIFLEYNNCTKWEYYYLTDADYYNDPKFISKFELFYSSLIYFANVLCPDFRVQNLETLIYLNQILPHNNINKLRSISCRHLGTSLYISMDGTIYPCGYFSDDAMFDDDKLSIGDIYHGFDKDALEKFCKEYFEAPMCNNSLCNCYNCFECPAVAKYRTKHLQGKLKQACNLRMVENLLYNKNKDNISSNKNNLESINSSYSYITNWNINKELYQDLPFYKNLHLFNIEGMEDLI